MNVLFLSKNKHKISEVKRILEGGEITVTPYEADILEIQSKDISYLVRDKCIKAYGLAQRPIFVEHTGLEINYLNGFPGGLTQVFWDTLKADRFAELFRLAEDKTLTAKTTIGYCDGRRIHQFEGKVEGTVPDVPGGNRDFQWDCVFVPDGYSKTFAELGETKDNISMRRLALNKFRSFLLKGSSVCEKSD